MNDEYAKSNQEEIDSKIKSIERKIKSIERGSSDKNVDSELLQMIHKGEIDVHDHDGPIKKLFQLCCAHERLAVVKTCIDLGVKVEVKALDLARLSQNPGMIELLLLSRMAKPVGDRVLTDCDSLNHEEAVLSFLCAELKLDSDEQQQLKSTLVDAITNLIKQRRPISSLLIRLALKLDPANVWNVLFTQIKQIIEDTTDVFGWCYLKKYILNQTFLFEKYLIPDAASAAVDQKDADNDDASLDASKRMLKDLNNKEVIVFLAKCVDLYHESDLAKDGYRLDSLPENLSKMYQTIETLHVDGNAFLSMSYKEFESILTAVDMANAMLFARFLKQDTPNSLKHDFQSLFIPFEVPFILEETYILSEVTKAAEIVSDREALKDIKAFYDEWAQSADEWQFILRYGQEWWMNTEDQTLRQSLQCKLSRRELVHKNIPLKFYDFSIFLNELFLECYQVNDVFQSDVQKIFADVADAMKMKFIRGPLKLRDRCMMKCEVDYSDQPFPTSACLLDIVRCTLVFDDLAGMVQGIKHFESEIFWSNNYCLKRILRVKNGFTEAFGTSDAIRYEYTDIKFNVGVVRLDGASRATEVICECQFLLKQMNTFKHKSHKLYSIFRQKEYFENLKLVSSLKKDWKSQFASACQSLDAAKITQMILDKGIATLDEIPNAESCVMSIVHAGNAEKGHKCLDIFRRLTPEKTFLALMKTKFGDGVGTPTTILMSMIRRRDLYTVKWLMACLKNDDERKELAQMDGGIAIKRTRFPPALKEYMSQWA